MERIVCSLSSLSFYFPPGEGGALFLASAFEGQNIDLVPEDGLDAFANVLIPDDIEVFQSDVPLVFIVDPIATGAHGVNLQEASPNTLKVNKYL